MILKKVEREGIIDCLYDSSNIVGSQYNTNEQKLSVIFKNGGKYTYMGVPKVEYLIFEGSPSQGKVLNSRIKEYSFVNEGIISVDDYILEIEKVREVEKANLKIGVIERMRDVVKRFDNYKEFDESGIDIAITLYNKFKHDGI